MSKLNSYILMYIAFLIYSIDSIVSKLASGYKTFSLAYIICFGLMIVILGVYAILWQVILKNMELSRAMAQKPFVLVLSSIWALVIFHEKLSVRVGLGMILILVGLVVLGVSDKCRGE